ncbi:MAG TPA: hypothetical protein VIJ27_13810 [Mucilaginibacter sp.]
MDVILACLGGFVLLFVCLKLPQWVANKTGKTIHIRGTFTNYITYKPDKWKEAQKQLKAAYDFNEHIDQILSGRKNVGLNYDNPYKLTDKEKAEYKLFNETLRGQLPAAIKEHIVITDFSDTSERVQITWLVEYMELYETLKTLNANDLTTLINGEYSQIEEFKNLYQKDLSSILERGSLGPIT